MASGQHWLRPHTLKHSARLVYAHYLLDMFAMLKQKGRCLDNPADLESEEMLDYLLDTHTERMCVELILCLAPAYLRSLSLKPCQQLLTQDVARILNKCRHLGALSLEGCKEIDLGQVVTSLRPALTSLVTLNVGSCQTLTDDRVQEVLKTCSCLHHLTLEDTPITDRAFLVYPSHQHYMEVAGQKWRGNERGSLCHLVTVNVSGCENFTNLGLLHLSSLTGPSLRALFAQQTQVDLYGLLYLSGHSKLSAKHFVQNLYRTAISTTSNTAGSTTTTTTTTISTTTSTTITLGLQLRTEDQVSEDGKGDGERADPPVDLFHVELTVDKDKAVDEREAVVRDAEDPGKAEDVASELVRIVSKPENVQAVADEAGRQLGLQSVHSQDAGTFDLDTRSPRDHSMADLDARASPHHSAADTNTKPLLDCSVADSGIRNQLQYSTADVHIPPLPGSRTANEDTRPSLDHSIVDRDTRLLLNCSIADTDVRHPLDHIVTSSSLLKCTCHTVVSSSLSQQNSAPQSSLSQQSGISQSSLSPQNSVIQSSLSQQNSVIQSSLSQQNSVVNLSSSQENSVMQSSLSQQNSVVNLSSSQENSVIQSSLSQENNVIQSSLSQENSVLQSSLSQENSVIQSSLSQENSVIQSSLSQQNSIIQSSLPQHNNVVQPSLPPQNCVIKSPLSQHSSIVQSSSLSHQNSNIQSSLPHQNCDNVIQSSAESLAVLPSSSVSSTNTDTSLTMAAMSAGGVLSVSASDDTTDVGKCACGVFPVSSCVGTGMDPCGSCRFAASQHLGIEIQSADRQVTLTARHTGDCEKSMCDKDSVRSDHHKDSERSDHHKDCENSHHRKNSEKSVHHKDGERSDQHMDSKRSDYHKESERSDNHKESERSDHHKDSESSDHKVSERSDHHKVSERSACEASPCKQTPIRRKEHSSPDSLSTCIPAILAHMARKEAQRVSPTPALMFHPNLMTLAISTNIGEVKVTRQFPVECFQVFFNANPHLKDLRLQFTVKEDSGTSSILYCQWLHRQILDVIGERAPHLQHLAISQEESGVNYLDDSSVSSLLSKCTQLQSLNMSGGFILTDQAFSTLQSNVCLERLCLCPSPITLSSPFFIQPPLPSQLTVLDLTWCDEVEEEGLNQSLAFCPSLTTLNLRRCAVTNHTVQVLAHHCPALQRLDIAGAQDLLDDAVVSLAHALPELTTLDLSGNCGLGDESIKALLTYCTRLETADFSCLPRITSKPFMAIVSGSGWEEWLRDPVTSSHQTPEDSRHGLSLQVPVSKGQAVPHRSSCYGSCLRHVDLSYCNSVDERNMRGVVTACRGGLQVINYYKQRVQPYGDLVSCLSS